MNVCEGTLLRRRCFATLAATATAKFEKFALFSAIEPFFHPITKLVLYQTLKHRLVHTPTIILSYKGLMIKFRDFASKSASP